MQIRVQRLYLPGDEPLGLTETHKYPPRISFCVTPLSKGCFQTPIKPQNLGTSAGLSTLICVKTSKHQPHRLIRYRRYSYQAIMICHDVILHPCQWTKLFPTMMTSKHFLRGRKTAQCQAVQRRNRMLQNPTQKLLSVSPSFPKLNSQWVSKSRNLSVMSSRAKK